MMDQRRQSLWSIVGPAYIRHRRCPYPSLILGLQVESTVNPVFSHPSGATLGTRDYYQHRIMVILTHLLFELGVFGSDVNDYHFLGVIFVAEVHLAVAPCYRWRTLRSAAIAL